MIVLLSVRNTWKIMENQSKWIQMDRTFFRCQIQYIYLLVTTTGLLNHLTGFFKNTPVTRSEILEKISPKNRGDAGNTTENDLGGKSNGLFFTKENPTLQYASVTEHCSTDWFFQISHVWSIKLITLMAGRHPLTYNPWTPSRWPKSSWTQRTGPRSARLFRHGLMSRWLDDWGIPITLW